jgi:Rrf2 family protein
MFISQKTRYGLRALYDLTATHGAGPRTVSDIAAAQRVPPRFLEVILADLRRAGLVDSRRGANGGHRLARDPATITVGEVVRLLERSLGGDGRGADDCEPATGLAADCAFAPLWDRVDAALREVVDGRTLADVHREHVERSARHEPNYSI